ncbi:unnamed protein product, partial [Rotaria sordida]
HYKVKSLKLESTSMERILLTTNYPNLYELGLYDIDLEKATSLFDDTTFIYVNKGQISSLVIDINKNKKQILVFDTGRVVFAHIFTMFINLQYLNFGPSSISYLQLSFGMLLPTVLSSNLLELHVCVLHFSDCLYLLDGRFNQLHTFYVNICSISSHSLTINNEEKLPNLRCFSLYCDMRTFEYDELIVPLLHRMLNLEKLDLHLHNVVRGNGFIDGKYLKENIINYMLQLNKFAFNIRSFESSYNLINLPSNEDIQHTFKEFKNNQIVSCVDYFQKRQCGSCHIYSYPYRMKYYDDITNNFPGGLFKYVQTVELFDDRPFEYEFFRQIAQSFPFMKNLSVINDKPQKNKLYRKSKKVDNQDLSIIEYPHLIRLHLYQAHDDYVEQFLVDTEISSNNTSSTNTLSSTEEPLLPTWQASACARLDKTLSERAPKPIGQLRHLIDSAAQETNVPADFIGAVIYQESRGNINVNTITNPGNFGVGSGFMQVNEYRGAELQQQYPHRFVSLYGIEKEIMLGASYLKQMYDTFADQDWGITFRAYNSGQNVDVLIHESTFETGFEVYASQMRHCTMAQAIDVGRRMNAKYTILWHFSQRYAKIPFLSDTKTEDESQKDEKQEQKFDNVCISFDFMRIHLSDLPRACELVPIFESMFYDEWLIMKKKQTRREQEPDYFTKNARMIESKRKFVSQI